MFAAEYIGMCGVSKKEPQLSCEGSILMQMQNEEPHTDLIRYVPIPV